VAQSQSLWQPVAPRRQRAAVAEQAGAEDRANAAFGISTAAIDSRSRQTIADSPAVCAQILLRYLVHHGFVDRVLPETAPPPVTAPVALPADQTAHAATPSLTPGLAPALRRSPRLTGDDERRRGRRPRPSATASPGIRPASVALARGPQRPEAGLAGGRRGPFRVSSTLDRSSH
jgi:hypothetical protein